MACTVDVLRRLGRLIEMYAKKCINGELNWCDDDLNRHEELQPSL
jgi:hypothetical protein